MDPNQQWNQGYNNQSWPQQDNNQGWNQQPLPPQQQQSQQQQQLTGQPPIVWDPNLPQTQNQQQPTSQPQWGLGSEQQWDANQLGSGANQLGSGINQLGSGPISVPIQIPPVKPKNDESLKIPGNTPGIKAGFLMKSGKKNTSLKKRYFVLIHDSLLYYKKDQTDKKAQGRIPMCEIITVEKAINKSAIKGKIEDYEQHFFFCIVTVERLYFILTNSLEECDHWVVSIMHLKNSIPYDGPEIARFPGSEDPNLVREGKLEKRGSDPSSGLKSRWFTLVYSNYESFDNYYLSYFKDKKAVIKMNTNRQPPKGTVPLGGCRLYIIGPELGEIGIANAERLYCLKAKTIKEMCEWLLDLKFAIDTANRSLNHKLQMEQSYAFNYRPPTFNNTYNPTLY